MIQILILDDSLDKATRIANILDTVPGIKYTLAHDLVSARKSLQEVYDLLILDMNLPERFNDLPKENNGIEFLKEIKKSRRLKLPKHIIGLTEYENLHEKFKGEFENNVLSLIKYDITTEKWSTLLIEKINYLIKTESQNSNTLEYDYDVAFITALRTPEFEALIRLPYNWEKFKISHDFSTYYRGTIKTNSRNLNVVATFLPQMGMTATAATTMKVINYFRPRYVIMCGICGGIKGKVGLGDVIIPDLSFDFGSGKVSINEHNEEFFEPDFRTIPLSAELKEELMDFTTNKEVLRKINDNWLGQKLEKEIKVHIGPMGSGAAVIANSDYIKKVISHQRKLVGIDMESYSIFYCCQNSSHPKPQALVIKVVSDFADPDKNDNIQDYASYVSVEIADYIIKNILE